MLSSPSRNDVLISMGANDYGNLGVGDVKGKSAARPYHVVDLHSAMDPEITEEMASNSLHINALHTGPHHVIIAIDVPLSYVGAADLSLNLKNAQNKTVSISGPMMPPSSERQTVSGFVRFGLAM